MKYQVQSKDILNNKQELKEFIQVSFNLYSHETKWIPQLRISQEELLNLNHPFFTTSKIKAWLLYDNKNKLCGRIMSIINHTSQDFHQDQCGFFGFFECIQDKSAFKLLLETASHHLKKEGLSQMRGPVNPSTNYECGVLIKGFEDAPQIMMPYNFSYYPIFFKELGYTKAMDLLSYKIKADFKMPEIIKKISARVEKSARISYRPINKKDWSNEVKKLYEIYNSAWAKNWGFIPMSKEEFIHISNDLKMVIDERLVLFAEVAGKPAGFIIALPDYNQIFLNIPNGKLLPTGIFKLLFKKNKINRVRILTMGLKPEFRKLGLASLLYNKCNEEIKKIKKFKEIDMSWILESNIEMNKPLIKMGAEHYKTHRIYQVNL